MIQNAKKSECDNYTYGIGEITNFEKLKSDKDLEKILPKDKIAGDNKFKDYQVPVNLDEFNKIIKQYITINVKGL